jgi:hypothetical protein
VRLGSEVDTDCTPGELLGQGGMIGQGQTQGLTTGLTTQASVRSKVLYGTANLRRSAHPEDLPLCLSLLLPTRTMDVQCRTEKERDALLAACLASIAAQRRGPNTTF